MSGPWRRPPTETVDLYPGLVVHDGRQTGSITAGRSRLPLWAFIHEAIVDGWDEVEEDYSPSDYGLTAQDLAIFLYNLLEARGDFGRLVLAIANAERAERDRETADFDAHFAEVHHTSNVCDCGRPLLPAWWEDTGLAAPVLDLLHRCAAILECRDDPS